MWPGGKDETVGYNARLREKCIDQANLVTIKM